MHEKTLPTHLRLIIGLAGLPSLLLGVMLVVTVVKQGVGDIGAFEVLYSLAGLVAVYIALTGKRLF